MINGSITEFIDKLYFGEELLFEYQGNDYFLQGWIKDGTATMVLDILKAEPFKDYIWKCNGPTIAGCAREFLNAKIWNKQAFMEIQREVTWKD